MNFGHFSNMYDFRITIGNEEICHAEYLKFLELNIDRKLAWDHHIDVVWVPKTFSLEPYGFSAFHTLFDEPLLLQNKALIMANKS